MIYKKMQMKWRFRKWRFKADCLNFKDKENKDGFTTTLQGK